MQYYARDIMNADVIAVPTTMDLRDLAKLFLEKGISGAPVLDAKGHLAGVISQTDLIYYNLTRGDELVLDSHFYHNARVEGHRVPTGFQFEDSNSGVVGDVMTPIVHSVAESATVEAVARLMTRKHIHRVIVRRGRGVAGIISALDVLRVHVSEGASAGRARAARRTASTRATGGSLRKAARGGGPARASKKARPAARRSAAR